MSNKGRPEFKALAELERVLGHVQEELASWRRRAHQAESDKGELAIDHDLISSRETISQLEQANQEKEERLGHTRERVDGLLARLQFLEEQTDMDEQGR